MIVLDASAAVDWLLQTPAGQRIEQRIYARNDTLHTVHLLDVEFAQVLRRLVREGTLARKRCVWQAGLAHFGILFWPTPGQFEI
jgi:predicted nucleic acid-binding protein